MAVCRDDTFSSRGLLDDRHEFLMGELLVDGMVDLRHHPARRADLDHSGVAPKIQPHGTHDFWHTVGKEAEMFDVVYGIDWYCVDVCVPTCC